ncbi:sulfite exporter TauE/SafE family protein [Alkalihalobacillus sp. AL-G]|uniref:sulfite exporter TauE/SafE family protein n=1 Tax=Alkalihalobacillus sp. AL-G TaxID=2926399 RepID=UPI00272AE000|nr:sulfite exporter TauE/SafE family protein [Alkalihalobacillus sp. AL-G]WLD94980.1 sulfite exporter TauE/SafE family protein [Alkalihalobacillus sp. AL-G]
MEISLFIIGFIATFIGTLAGSGGLINLPAMLLIGVPIHSAIASNKFSNTLSSFSSFFVLLRKKEVDLKSALKIAPFSFVGGIAGGLIASSLSENVMMIIGISLLIVAFLVSFIGKPVEQSSRTSEVSYWTYPSLFGIGTYDGMFGPGQATFQMYLFFYQGIGYLRTIAYTRFNTFLSCLGAFITYFFADLIRWDVAIPLAIGSILGSQIAVRLAGKFSKTAVKILLRIITVLLLIQLVYQVVKGSV